MIKWIHAADANGFRGQFLSHCYQHTFVSPKEPRTRPRNTHPCEVHKPSQFLHHIIKRAKLHARRASNDDVLLRRLPREHHVRVLELELARRVHLSRERGGVGGGAQVLELELGLGGLLRGKSGLTLPEDREDVRRVHTHVVQLE